MFEDTNSGPQLKFSQGCFTLFIVMIYQNEKKMRTFYETIWSLDNLSLNQQQRRSFKVQTHHIIVYMVKISKQEDKYQKFIRWQTKKFPSCNSNCYYSLVCVLVQPPILFFPTILLASFSFTNSKKSHFKTWIVQLYKYNHCFIALMVMAPQLHSQWTMYRSIWCLNLKIYESWGQFQE